MIDESLLILCKSLAENKGSLASQKNVVKAIKLLDSTLQKELAVRAYEAACLAYSKAWHEGDADEFSIQVTTTFNMFSTGMDN